MSFFSIACSFLSPLQSSELYTRTRVHRKYPCAIIIPQIDPPSSSLTKNAEISRLQADEDRHDQTVAMSPAGHEGVSASDDPRPVVVISSLNRDTTHTVTTLPLPGETVLSHSVSHTLGGKGANTAVAAAKAGAPSHFLGAIGSSSTISTTSPPTPTDADRTLLQQLADLRVDTSTVRCIPGSETGCAVILLETDSRRENSIVVHPGANFKLTADVVDDISPVILKQCILALHLEIPHAVVRDVARQASYMGACVVLNPSPVPVNDSPLLPGGSACDVWSFLDILIVNRIELALLAGEGCEGSDGVVDVEALTHRIDNMQRRLDMRDDVSIIVTLGPDGALVSTANNTNCVKATKPSPAEGAKTSSHLTSIQGRSVQHVKAMRVDNVVDTTGAGDCLTGYVCAGLAAGVALPLAVRTAVAAAGLCVGRKGASHAMPEMTEVEACMRVDEIVVDGCVPSDDSK